MASQMYMKRGTTAANEGDLDGGYNAFRKAYSFDPTNELAKAEMERMIRLKQETKGGQNPDKKEAGAKESGAKESGAKGSVKPADKSTAAPADNAPAKTAPANSGQKIKASRPSKRGMPGKRAAPARKPAAKAKRRR